ncbi:MAG: VWA domain-containing protein [Thalassolituus oleivorans]|uniref:VWA domain-containing protein n=1 Tax=Thalassolituus oleivorans TaxID=187493 RepID=UPI001B4870B6|nr:VWA domain-containing protein [Thalassolituus oleivorans]MBQ0727255.1 VWA domain-containing protein [Thalassolituus oleivorans]MBQ0780321.1 VWA domain-containing protein [Thalassolituus oleivorans]
MNPLDWLVPLSDFHFLRPMWLLLFIPAVIAFVMLLKQRLGEGDWQQVVDPALRAYVLDRAPKQSTKSGHWWILIAWLVATLALSGPTWQRIPVPVMKNQDALVILMDMSLSMGSQDIKPSRAIRSVQKVTDIIRERKDGLTAVIAYSGDAHIVTPFTDDGETIEHLLPSLTPEIMPKLGSRPDKAIKLAQELMTNANIRKAQFLLLTDGIQPNDVTRIKDLLGENTPLAVIAIGTADGAPVSLGDQGFLRDNDGNIVLPRLDTAPLNELRAQANVPWLPLAFDDRDWKTLLKSEVTANNEEADSSRNTQYDQWHDAGFWLIFLLLPIALITFRRGVVFTIVLIPALWSQPSDAADLKDLWQTPDQQGQELFAKDPSAAAKKFQNPSWKGSALYKSGDYQGAVDQFSQDSSARGKYNEANALAQTGDLEKALEAYDEAIQRAGNDAELLKNAEANRQLVEKIKEQQEKQQQNQQQNQQSSDDNQSSDDKNNSDQKNNQQQNDQQKNSDENQSSDQSQSSDSQQSDSKNQQNDSQSQDQQNSSSSQQEDDDYAEQQAQKNKEQKDQEQKDSKNAQSQADQEQQEKESEDGKNAAQAGEKSDEEQDKEDAQSMAQQQQEQDQNGENQDDTLGQLDPNASQQDGMTREEKAARQNWLNRVPDNPGVLLQRKFLYQYRQQADDDKEEVLW